jgi:hypothetical protein
MHERGEKCSHTFGPKKSEKKENTWMGDNIRMDIREISGKVWTGFIWLRIGTTENGNEPPGSIKGEEFLG